MSTLQERQPNYITELQQDSHYDYLIVGAGLTAGVFADAAKQQNKNALIIDRRPHLAGNIYTEKSANGIDVHKYGAHIFHTSLIPVWNYVNRFAEFNNYINSPVARFHDELYNLPFNMNTFSKMWSDVVTPEDAKKKIDEQVAAENISEPTNLEEQALSLVGRDIFTKLVKEYTEKQWNADCKDLPADIIKRLPVRFIYDNNYFNDPYQGIPKQGYTKMVENMMADTDVLLSTDYKELIKEYPNIADKVIYTGPIDEYFDFVLGPLTYRSLRFDTEELPNVDNWQGNAVINYTSHDEKFTRIIEHKHFTFMKDENGKDIKGTIITREYPADWRPGDEPYYPLNNDENMKLYQQYVELAEKQGDVRFAGRLGGYKYYDMDKCIDAAFDLVEDELGVDLRSQNL